MKFQLAVEVEVERESGKFASRDEICDALISAILDAHPDTIDRVGADGGSVYNVTEWNVGYRVDVYPEDTPMALDAEAWEVDS